MEQDNFEMIENPQFLYEGSLSSEDEVLDVNQRNNFDFNLDGFKDEFLGSSDEEQEEPEMIVKAAPKVVPKVAPQPPPTQMPFDVDELERLNFQPSS